MRIHVLFADRVGITQEILQALSTIQLNVTAVEMTPPNVYIDAPELNDLKYGELEVALRLIKGVIAVNRIEILPGHHWRLQLDTLLSAMSDPIVAVDYTGTILLSNPAFIKLARSDGIGRSLGEHLGAPDVLDPILKTKGKQGLREVSLGGNLYTIETTPVQKENGAHFSAGYILTFYAPTRIGERITSHTLTPGLDTLLGVSQPMIALKTKLIKLAKFDAPVLIHGET